MTEKILVPVLGESITEATVSKWLKSKGEKINADEAILELETDKVNLEVPSPISGTLTIVNFKDGDTVEVGAVLGEISEGPGDQIQEDNKNIEKPKKKSSGNVINFDKEKKQNPKIFESEEKEEPLVLTEEEPLTSNKEEPLVLTKEIPGKQKIVSEKVLSPAVRKIVEENKIDIQSIKGTGRSGQILKGDLISLMGSAPQPSERKLKYGAIVPEGVFSYSVEELLQKAKSLKTEKFVLKAQIHAGGRGKAGGIKIVNTIEELNSAAKEMLGKKLITHQTGPQGREVKRLYVESSSEIEKEFYLSCLVDRASSKIAFISSDQGGMDIEDVAKNNPKKIVTTKINLDDKISDKDCEKIVEIFNLSPDVKKQAINLIKSIYKMFIDVDANLVEINPLILTKENKIICLDAKMSFDDNALFRNPEILNLRDLNEEEEIEIEANKHGLSYIKLEGSIGCMVNGAGLAMATMDIIKLYGEEPANFLDVGGGASKEKVSAAFKIILSDKNVKGILINIFGGIMRCDVLAQGVVDAAKEVKIEVPLIVRLAGTKFEEGKKILDNSDLKIISASDLSDAAKKVVESIK